MPVIAEARTAHKLIDRREERKAPEDVDASRRPRGPGGGCPLIRADKRGRTAEGTSDEDVDVVARTITLGCASSFATDGKNEVDSSLSSRSMSMLSKFHVEDLSSHLISLYRNAIVVKFLRGIADTEKEKETK